MKRISVLAGNPKVQRTNGKIVLEDGQLLAFEEALKFTKSVREAVFRIVLAFDHPGIFAEQFLADREKVSSRGKKRLTLSQLHGDIRSAYAEIVKNFDVQEGDIKILTEDYLRLDILSRSNDPRLYKPSLQCLEGQVCRIDDDDKDEEKKRVNCRGITAAITERLAENANEVRTFWVYDEKRVNHFVITQGTELAFEILGVRTDVHQTMFYPEISKSKTISFRSDQEARERVSVEIGKTRDLRA